MTKLSDTQRMILSQASQRDEGLAVPPEHLPAAARQTVARSLLNQRLVSDEDAGAHAARNAWQIDGQPRLLRITATGLAAIGLKASPYPQPADEKMLPDETRVCAYDAGHDPLWSRWSCPCRAGAAAWLD